MKTFLLGFCTADKDIVDDPNNRRYFRCQAENESDAIKQLEAAEPTANFSEVIKVEN